MGFTHGWQWYSSNTQAYWNSGCKILLFETEVKGLMEGLNKLCLCPCTWDHEYPSMQWAKFNLGQLVKVQAHKNTKPMGDHWHINNGTSPTDCHTFDPLFSPLHQPKTPVFTKNCHPKSYFFSHCPEFWKFFTQRPLIGWLEFEKKVPKCPLFLWLLSLKDPYFLPCRPYTHGLFEGNVAPSNMVRRWKILYSRNRIVQFVEYFQVQI